MSQADAINREKNIKQGSEREKLKEKLYNSLRKVIGGIA